MFKTEILTPIHLGRAVEKEKSRDGNISDVDLKWLHQNCIGDDSYDNISKYNRRVGFFTGTYWAWKNYEKLGNPKYFGFFGYRRLMEPSFLDNLNQYDLIIPNAVDFLLSGKTIKRHIIKIHGINLYNIMIKVFKARYPAEFMLFEEYLKSRYGYMYEIYVMNKKIFFDFCDFIYPLLYDLLRINPNKYTFSNNSSIEANFIKEIAELRDIGYVMEILTGYYCYKLKNDKSIKCKQQEIEFIIDYDKEDKRKRVIAKLLRQSRLELGYKT